MVRVERLGQAKVTLGTTLTRIAAGDGVRTVYAVGEADMLLVYSNTLEDGGVLPGGAHQRIPSGMAWPIEIGDKRPFLAVSSGTPAVTLTGTS